MELVREDGHVKELKEGERLELGRSSEFDAAADKTISRLHVIVELLRPTSRKGKEVVGKSNALKLHVRVVGRNPICIRTTSLGARDSASTRIKFAKRGEIDWLAPGDKFALSIRQPLFFVVRQSSRGSLEGEERFESHGAGRISNAFENQSDRPVEKNNTDVESKSMEEEDEIAKAVARRQRRRLEREVEQQRMRLSEQQQSRDGGLDDSERLEPEEESFSKKSAVPRRTNDLYSVNPVLEFGFLVKGSEFQAFEKRSKTENGVAWKWKIDKIGGKEENVLESTTLGCKSKMTSRDTRNVARPEEEDEEWGGDTQEEEERVSKAIRPKAESTVSTRLRRSKPQGFNTRVSNRSGGISTDGEDLIHRSGDDPDDSIEEDDDDPDESEDEDEDEDEEEEEDEDDDEDEIEDEEEDDKNDLIGGDENVSNQTEKRLSTREKQKPACKYGSKCYRKNEEHLSQFSHPQ